MKRIKHQQHILAGLPDPADFYFRFYACRRFAFCLMLTRSSVFSTLYRVAGSS
jgi:hypothetical protein